MTTPGRLIAFPIVGSFYRPPAKAIVESIPVGTPLTLRAEPTNPVDPNAIAVYIRTVNIPEASYKAIVLAGASCGLRIGEEPSESAEAFLASLLAVPEWHLGYIPAVEAKTAAAQALVQDWEALGQFLVLSGKPAWQGPREVL